MAAQQIPTLARMSAPHDPNEKALVLGSYIPSTRRDLAIRSAMCRTKTDIGKIGVFFGTDDEIGRHGHSTKSVYLPFFKEA